MFEVEKKFILSQDDIARLTEDAEFLGEKTFTDIYFDTAEFALTKNDLWLRSRGGKFELKIPKHLGEKSLSQQYQEVEGEENLRQIFAIAPQHDFLQDIADFGYAPFCELETTRRKFKKEGFIIDLDEVIFEDFKYAVGEIELLVETEAEMEEALNLIENFAKKSGLKSEPVRGKVIEYLKKKKPEHYQALVSANVISESCRN